MHIIEMRKAFAKATRLLKLGEEGVLNPVEAAKGALNVIGPSMDEAQAGRMTNDFAPSLVTEEKS